MRPVLLPCLLFSFRSPLFLEIFSFVCQADVCLVELERKVRALEQEKTLETTEDTLFNLRGHLNHPNSAFDRFEVLDIFTSFSAPRAHPSTPEG